MRALFLGLAIIAGIVTVACGGGEDNGGESAGDAVKRQLDYVSKGQWGKEWDELHPAHQMVVPKDLFVRCASERDFEFDSVKIIDTYEEPINVESIPEKTSQAVTVEIKGNVGILGTPDTITETFHELLVDGKWRWPLKEDVLEAYKKGECPP